MRFHRVITTLHEIGLRHTHPERDSTIVVVAHGGVLDDVGRLLKGVPFGKGTGLRKPNAGISFAIFTAHAPSSAEPCDLGVAFPKGAVEPEDARTRLGVWTLQHWGLTAHLLGCDVGGGVSSGAAAVVARAGTTDAAAASAVAEDAESGAVSGGV